MWHVLYHVAYHMLETLGKRTTKDETPLERRLDLKYSLDDEGKLCKEIQIYDRKCPYYLIAKSMRNYWALVDRENIH